MSSGASGVLSVAEQSIEDDDNDEPMSTYDRVVDLLNQAALKQKDKDKVADLLKVQELIINKEVNLLDNFLDEVLAFQTSTYADVKKYVISFMEEACKVDPEILIKVVPNLNLLLHDENVAVTKKALLCLPKLFVFALKWIGTAKTTTDEMEQIWEAMNQMKITAMKMLESDNDGVRTHAVKCVEVMVIALSEKTQDSEIPKKQEMSFTIDQVSSDHKIFKLKKLQLNGQKTFGQLLHFQASAHISSINLMTVVSALTNIGLQRPQFFTKVIQSFEILHVNLPPTLAKSQVSSVRKNLKLQLLQLLKHKASYDHVTRITTLLIDLGATQPEISKCIPKYDTSRKRKTDGEAGNAKKMKTSETELEIDDDEPGMTPLIKTDSQPNAKLRALAIDITTEDILEKLTPENVADLVLVSMVMLPEGMPAPFSATYTPISEAGTKEQINHLSRLLATQLTMAGMGEGIAKVLSMASNKSQEETSKDKLEIPVIGKETSYKAKLEVMDLFKRPTLPASTHRGIKKFNLENVTRSLTPDVTDSMISDAFARILDADTKLMPKQMMHRLKLLSSLGTHCGSLVRKHLLNYICGDLKKRADLAFTWLYHEYSSGHGFNNSNDSSKASMSSYNDCVTLLLSQVHLKDDGQHSLFARFYLESPLVTDNALLILKAYCKLPKNCKHGVEIVSSMIHLRPRHRLTYLSMLMELATFEQHDVRLVALECLLNIYSQKKLCSDIEEFAMTYLRFLQEPKPPSVLLSHLYSKQSSWGEDLVKMCLSVYLILLPANHSLIHELALVYTASSADIKRIVLRIIEAPVKGIGMESSELLKFVETCPKGAETLVTRVIHVLTEKANPSQDLVTRVKDLYQKRVPDVRFLIPVLTGLSKKEIIAALPKLIKLNPVVVKEVFHRLLGSHTPGNTSNMQYFSPISPADFLVVLHNIDPTKCDIKTVIKATNLCFQEPEIYTQEVLALVMQQLMDQPTIPTLFMRTVLQSLSLYPQLMGLVLNILQRLIVKKVWEDKKVWEGFIRCCQKTRPQSFNVLLQLPAHHLADVFVISPELRTPLLEHVNQFTKDQRAYVPEDIIKTLEMSCPPTTDSSESNNSNKSQKGPISDPAHDAKPIPDLEKLDDSTSNSSQKMKDKDFDKTEEYIDPSNDDKSKKEKPPSHKHQKRRSRSREKSRAKRPRQSKSPQRRSRSQSKD